MTGTEMTHDRIGDVYYDASRSDETVSLKGLCAVADAADRAAARRTLDELRTFVEALDLGYWDRMAFLEKCGEMREGLE